MPRTLAAWLGGMLMAAGVALAGTGPEATADAGTARVRIVVRHADSGEPAREFSYRYSVETAERRDAIVQEDLVPVASADGSVVIEVPRACGLWVRAEVLVGELLHVGGARVPIRADGDVIVELEARDTCRGRVVAADTGEPVAGALVSPMAFTMPLPLVPDRKRGVRTDADGTFILRDSGHEIEVEHPDFLSRRHRADADAPGVDELLHDVIVELVRGDSVFGLVVDEAGVPIEGAMLKVNSTKSALTGADGRYRINGVLKQGDKNPGYSVWVEAPGFVPWSGVVADVPDGGFRIVLIRCLRVTGRVTDERGRPVPRFVAAGGPGRQPGGYRSTRAEFGEAADGWFALDIQLEPDRNWVCVGAEGFAPDVRSIGFDRAGFSADFVLTRGVEVRGSVAGVDEPVRGGVATLMYRHGGAEPGRYRPDLVIDELCAREAAIGADGSFAFEHVRPGHYVLWVGGENFSGRNCFLSVPGKGASLEPIRVQGVGRIVVTVVGREGPREFAQGEIRHPGLRADKDGRGERRFRANLDGVAILEGVPLGEVTVSAPAGMRSSYVKTAIVREGETAVVTLGPDIFAGPFGDAGEDAAPLASGPGSIAGRATLPGDERWRERGMVYANARVFGVGEQHPGCHAAAADSEGRFALAALPPDRYRLICWHAVLGWFGVEAVEVGDGVVEVGERAPGPGATLDAEMHAPSPTDLPTAVRLRHEAGFEFTPIEFYRTPLGAFRVHHLWPGRWTVSVMAGERVLGASEFGVVGAGSVGVTVELE